MAFKEQYTTVDGFSPMTKGMHSGLDPVLLDSNGQYAYGVNVTTRGGFVKTRPGFALLGTLPPSLAGKFQGAAVYSLDEADHLVYAVSGRVFVRNGVSGETTGIDGTLSESADRVYFTQVYRWIICQDGSSRPIVVEETKDAFSNSVFARVAKDAVLESTETGPLICVVPGTIGAYAHGRYHYVPAVVPAPLPELQIDPADSTQYLNADAVPVPVPDTPVLDYDGPRESGKTCFVSSDVLDPLDPMRVFRMTEHRSLDEGGAYALPAELGFVHGMGAMRGAATGTGVGSLYVFGSRGVSAFEVSSPRSSYVGQKSWKDIAFSQVAFYGAGTYSPFSIVNINDDIWYVDATKNLRSVGYDNSQLAGGGYAAPAMFNTTKSFECRRWAALTEDSYRGSIYAALADNRLHWLMCGGKGACSLDFAQTYTAIPAEIPPLHEGLWTGFDFKWIGALGGVLHAIVEWSDGRYALVSAGDANDADPNDTDIESFIVTKYYSGMYNEMYHLHEPKKLSHVDLMVAGVTRPTTVSIYFRPLHYTAWTLLGSQEINVPPGTPPQVRTKLRFSINPAKFVGCNAVTKEVLYTGHAFQFRIAWTGRMQIDRFTVFAPILDEAPRLQCQTDNAAMVPYPAEEFHDYDYEVPL